ncbi:MAG: translocation/assembly module TamB domain-containing protein [Acidobacteria bacterium]|nr:translocation/assembly module TamB domain-containing protein [Acidobacteriota bacterium]
MRRMAKRSAIGLVLVTALAYAAWWWLLRSAWLREQLRARALQEIERATGGKAELGKFDFDPALLGATFERFTLHGTEPAGAPPLVQAERVEIGLKILSFIKPSVDVGRIEIVRPRVNVMVDAEGRSNLPSPAAKRPGAARGPVEEILRLAADTFAVRDGEFNYDTKKYPFSASGKNLRASFDYDAKGPVYRGKVESDALQVHAGKLPRLPVNASASVVVEKDAVDFSGLRIVSAASTVTGRGRIEQFQAAHGDFALNVDTDLTESARLFHAPAGHGAVHSSGRFQWFGGTRVRYDGDVRAPALDVELAGVRVRPVAVTARVVATEKDLDVSGIHAKTTEGAFTGSASLPGYVGYIVDGKVDGLALRTLVERSGNRELGYSALLSGPVRLTGNWTGGMTLDASMDLARAEGGVPLEGQVTVHFDKAASTLTLRDSYLTTPDMRVDAAGTLKQTLRVKFSATKLDGVRPALQLAGITSPLPVKLENGSVLFEGTISGELHAPLIAGQLRALNAKWEDVRVDALSTTLLASADKLTLTRFNVTQDGATASGNATIGLQNWRPGNTSPIDIRADGRNLNAGNLRRQAGFAQPVEGAINATVQLQGTVDDPRGEVRLDWFRPAYGEERLDRVKATLRHNQNTLEITAFEATRGTARFSGTGTFTHPHADWKNGSAAASFQLAGVDLREIPKVQALRKGVSGALTASGKAQARIVNGEPELAGLDMESGLTGIRIDDRPYGDLALDAETQNGKDLQLTVKGTLRGAPVTATSQWRLEAGYPGTARVEFGELPFAVFTELRQTSLEQWPFTGAFKGSVDFSGPATNIDQWKVAVNLQELYARPSRGQTLPGKATAQDFELRNDGPVRFTSEGRTVTIRSARFVAKDTNLSASGTFSLAERRPWDLKVDGQLNLAGLRSYSQDIVASGVATLQANIRGELASPQVFGALELKNATLNVDGLPNGLDKVNGRLLFDRRRATIEDRLRAESGGGALALGGFIDFSSEDTFYRLQADASAVRIRYPEGVSTVADANITLSGTTERSLLAGTVTVLRSGFQPRTDIGSLLAESSRAEATPREANRFLANMQVDVKVRTAPETQFTTSLTNDLQAEANLQLRGTGARPVALGRITISQGDINFFGNKYSIKRGEVSFYNPTKVEPTLDLDLETRVRGVDVTVNFTGPIDKLNVSYRSDPPLQPSEIIALLTVGRSPTSSTVGSSQSGARGSFLESGANSLLGSAISAPISSQLQRFFGVSRIKIDPTISGLEGTPQARVTVEQQVSKDVTITFVTNLNRSQQQVVRFEWNLSKEWSLIMLRDENGAFGVDFQVRKQVK